MKSRRFVVFSLVLLCLAGFGVSISSGVLFGLKESADEAKAEADAAEQEANGYQDDADAAKWSAEVMWGIAGMAKEHIPVEYRTGTDWTAGCQHYTLGVMSMSMGDSNYGARTPSPGTGAGLGMNYGDADYTVAEEYYGENDYFSAACFYRDARDHYSHAGRWDTYQTGYYYAASHYFNADSDFTQANEHFIKVPHSH